MSVGLHVSAYSNLPFRDQLCLVIFGLYGWAKLWFQVGKITLHCPCTQGRAEGSRFKSLSKSQDLLKPTRHRQQKHIMSILLYIVRSIVMLIVIFKKKYTGYQYCDKTGRNLWSTHIVLSQQLEHPGIHTSAKHFIVTNNDIDHHRPRA